MKTIDDQITVQVTPGRYPAAPRRARIALALAAAAFAGGAAPAAAATNKIFTVAATTVGLSGDEGLVYALVSLSRLTKVSA